MAEPPGTAALDVQLATPWLGRLPVAPEVEPFARWFARSFYLDVGHLCNQSCRYCFQDKRGARFMKPADLEGPIRAAGALGLDAAILIGGEPLIFPGLGSVLAGLRREGFGPWGVMTNGAALRRKGFLDRLVERGLGFCQLSFDSPDPATQNGLSRNPRLFASVQGALGRFSRHEDLPLVLNAVVTGPNVGQLTELVRHADALRSRLGLRPFVTLTQAKLHGAMEPGLAVAARAAAKAVAAAVLEGRRLGLPVLFRNLPFCLMDGLERWSTDWFTRLRRMDCAGEISGASGSGSVPRGRCLACAHYRTCPGVSAAYLERFGDGEFQPVCRAADDAAADAHPAREARFPIGAMSDGAPVYFPARALRARLPGLGEATRLVLVGPEPLFHPKLPELIGEYSSKGFSVWLETAALALAKPRRAEYLRSAGLAGVVWLHPPPAALDRLLPQGAPKDFRRSIGLALRRARLPADHIFAEPAPAEGSPRGGTGRGPGASSGLGAGLTISLLLGTRCNFRCGFCYLDNHRWTLSREKALESVDRLLGTGCRRFLLAGGEPTVFAHLAEVIGRISASGAETILVSNGLKLARRPLARQLKEAGLRRVILSMHSHRPEVFARLVHVPGALSSVLDGFENLLLEGLPVCVHHVFCPENLADFPGFVRFYADRLRRPGLTELSVSNLILMRPDRAARPRGVPRLGAVRPYLEEGSRLARERGFEVCRGDGEDAFPECVFGSREPSSPRPAQQRWIVPPGAGEPGVIFAGSREELPDVAAFGAKDYNRIFFHPRACRSCRRRPSCPGVQAGYVAAHGDGEIRPIKTDGPTA